MDKKKKLVKVPGHYQTYHIKKEDGTKVEKKKWIEPHSYYKKVKSQGEIQKSSQLDKSVEEYLHEKEQYIGLKAKINIEHIGKMREHSKQPLTIEGQKKDDEELLKKLRKIELKKKRILKKWLEARKEGVKNYRDGWKWASYWDKEKQEMVYYKDEMTYKQYIDMRFPKPKDV